MVGASDDAEVPSQTGILDSKPGGQMIVRALRRLSKAEALAQLAERRPMSTSNIEVPQDRSRNRDPLAVARSNSFTGEGKGPRAGWIVCNDCGRRSRWLSRALFEAA
jgi:hypothetical protein